jgi:L-fuconolactonase
MDSKEALLIFTQHLPWLKGEDLEWVIGRGVREWLGWR